MIAKYKFSSGSGVIALWSWKIFHNLPPFLKKNLKFTIKLSLGLKNRKTTSRLMLFLILKPKTTSVFYSDRPFMRGTVFHNTVKWGKKFDFPNWHRKCALWHIKRFVFYRSETKIGGHLCPRGSKIWSQNHFLGGFEGL